MVGAARALQPAGMPHAVIPGFLNWTLAFNTGAAFSFLAGGAGWQRWFFVALAVVISACWWSGWRARARRDWRTAVPLALIIGGAIGNLIDRLHAARSPISSRCITASGATRCSTWPTAASAWAR